MLTTKIFGCKTNKFYAQQWLGSGELDGYSGIFVVSCVVTNQAKARWVKYIKKEVQNLTEDSYIFLSGCGSLDKGKLDPDFWDKYPELTEWKEKIIPIGEEPHKIEGAKKVSKKKLNTSILQEKLKKLESAKKLYTRKSIVIQSGCDTHCTFCATIQARGSHRNRSAEDIIAEIQDYEKTGGKEIVITGINLGAWGATNTTQLDTTRFPELLEMILDQTDIPRIRISSTGVEFVSKKLLKLYTNPRINPHIHLSVQSGSDEILSKMNRKYNREKLLQVLGDIRNLERTDNVEISIGADIIIGFPGETDKDFKESLDLISEYQITKLHAFPFSGHGVAHNVPAAKFKDQVMNNVKYARLREMIQLGDTVRSEFLERNIGKNLTCLIEKNNPETGEFSGWSENYILINQDNFKLQKGEIKKNSIISGKLIHANGNTLENTESII